MTNYYSAGRRRSGSSDRPVEKKRVQQLIAGVAFASLLPFFYIGGNLLYKLYEVDVAAYPPAEHFYQVKTAHNPTPELGTNVYREYPRPFDLTEYHNLKRNIGTVDWYADLYLPEFAAPKFLITPHRGKAEENPDYLGEAFFTNDENLVKDVKIKSNTIEVAVRVRTPGRLVVNQNHHRGWKSDHGQTISENGLLAVQLPKTGAYDVRFRFSPASFWWGLDLTVLSFLICILAWWKGRPQKRSGSKK